MPTRKIAEARERPCSHPEHNPPSMMVFKAGVYEHECPSCGHKQVFRIDSAYMKVSRREQLPKWITPTEVKHQVTVNDDGRSPRC